MREHPIMQRILHALSQGSSRLFRVNTGTAWQGKGQPGRVSRPTMMMINPGDVVLRAAQPIKMGLIEGGSDCLGWETVTVTPEMIGRDVGVFCAIEVKRDDKPAKATEEQLIFIRNVQRAGGIAGVARSVPEAQAIIDEWRLIMGC